MNTHKVQDIQDKNKHVSNISSKRVEMIRKTKQKFFKQNSMSDIQLYPKGSNIMNNSVSSSKEQNYSHISCDHNSSEKLVKKLIREINLTKSELKREKTFGRKLIKENLSLKEDQNYLIYKKDQLELVNHELEKKYIDLKLKYSGIKDGRKKLVVKNERLQKKIKQIKHLENCALKKVYSEGNLRSNSRKASIDSVDSDVSMTDRNEMLHSYLSTTKDLIHELRKPLEGIKTDYYKFVTENTEFLSSITKKFSEIEKTTVQNKNDNQSRKSTKPGDIIGYVEIQQKVIEDLGLLSFYDKLRAHPTKESELFMKDGLFWKRVYIVASFLSNTLSIYPSKLKNKLKRRYSLQDVIINKLNENEKIFSLQIPTIGEIFFKPIYLDEKIEWIGFLEFLFDVHKKG